MRKEVITLLFATLALFQGKELAAQVKIEPKVNLAMAAITIFNPAAEITFGKRSSIEFEYYASFSEKNFMGSHKPFVINVGTFEYRHYLKGEAHEGFYSGLEVGRFSYMMSKDVVPFISHVNSKCYNWGYGFLVGTQIGYKKHLGERFSLEVSAAGGWQRSKHEIINSTFNVTYPLNPTGEWLLYKGGITLGYRIPLR